MFSEEESCLGPQKQLLPLPPGWASPLLTQVPALCLLSGCPTESASQQLLGSVPPPSLGKAEGGHYPLTLGE